MQKKELQTDTYTGPLAGVPVAIKDNICIKGNENNLQRPEFLRILNRPYTCRGQLTVWKKQELIIIGKTNMDEFAMGSTTETSYYGVTKNPMESRNMFRAVLPAVPVRQLRQENASMALGSDTGGSIRQPSSFCGVTGIKPTYGTVSRYGLIAYGVFAGSDRTGRERMWQTVPTLLEAIACHDPKDSTSLERNDL